MNIFEAALLPMQVWAKRAETKLDEWASGKVDGLSTGFKTLDSYLRLVNSEYTLVAARPSMGKCLGKGTKVLMFDGSLKSVEDIVVGDKLMGPDSTPRNVISLARGREMMYWVHQKHGVSYRVNESHILSLKRSKNDLSWRKGDVVNIPISEVKDKGPGFFSRFKGYKSSVDFAEKDLPIDPYFFGLWLGDGGSSNSIIYNTDQEVIDYIHEYANERQEYVKVKDLNRSCQGYHITGGRTYTARSSCIASSLNRLGVLDNKHIPDIYLINSKANRIALLAGLIDSDGHYLAAQNGPYEITLKNRHLTEQIKFLCDSLGYRTSINEKWAKTQHGYECVVYRVRFNGNVDEIPVKIERKKANAWTDFRDWRVTAISIEQDIIDDYYGFVIDGDHLFLLEDMTVTHNTSICMQIGENVAKELQRTNDNGVVAVFSAEMSGTELVIRMASALSGVNAHALRNGYGKQDEFARFRESIDAISGLPIWIDDSSGPTTATMLQRLDELNQITPVRLMLFDFVELGGDSAQSEELRISSIHKHLKGIAKALNIPVWGISQLSREVEKRGDKIPQLADLRYSGMAEQVADKVVFIMRPEYYIERQVDLDVPDEDRKGVAYVLVAKNRNGPVGMVKMAYIKERSMFGDLKPMDTVRVELN